MSASICVQVHRPRRCRYRSTTGVELIRASKATAARYECAQPGQLVSMDFKQLGKISDGGGWRAHGRTGVVRPQS